MALAAVPSFLNNDNRLMNGQRTLSAAVSHRERNCQHGLRKRPLWYFKLCELHDMMQQTGSELQGRLRLRQCTLVLSCGDSAIGRASVIERRSKLAHVTLVHETTDLTRRGLRSKSYTLAPSRLWKREPR